MPEPEVESPWRVPGYVFSREGDGCWGCSSQRLGGHRTLLGFCEWFPAHGKGEKAIPGTVVDVGCRFWERKVRDGRTAQ
jgi:hypothetical protein